MNQSPDATIIKMILDVLCHTVKTFFGNFGHVFSLFFNDGPCHLNISHVTHNSIMALASIKSESVVVYPFGKKS